MDSKISSMIIHLISGPRNISTALMYSFAQRKDTAVIDEPFYGHYLQSTGIKHPGSEAVINKMEKDPMVVRERIEYLARQTPNLFIKNMAHHLQGFDYTFISNYQNVFLIRDPWQMLISYGKVIKKPTLHDIGLKRSMELFQWLSEMGNRPVVIDGTDVRKNPRGLLTALCDKIEIPFDENMLHWQAGPRPEDGIWARYWYGRVHQSTGFDPPESSDDSLPVHLQDVYEEALPYYRFFKPLMLSH